MLAGDFFPAAKQRDPAVPVTGYQVALYIIMKDERFKRILTIDLPTKQSAFLWGPRKTGKTTLLREKFSNSIFVDFLRTDTFLEYTKAPFLLREHLLVKSEQAKKYPVILDEV